MNVTYLPAGINNFHGKSGIKLRITGETIEVDNRKLFVISVGQAKRIERHFCGCAGCRCPKGGAYQLNAAGAEFAIPKGYARVEV